MISNRILLFQGFPFPVSFLFFGAVLFRNILHVTGTWQCEDKSWQIIDLCSVSQGYLSAWIVKAHGSTIFQQPLSSSLPTLQNISPVTSQVKVKSSDLNLLFALVLLTDFHIDFHDLY